MHPWEENYVTRTWVKHEGPYNGEEAAPLVNIAANDPSLHLYNTDDPRAAEDDRRFFHDWELIAAEAPLNYGVAFGKLTRDWKGHKEGSLVMTLHTNPPFSCLYIVEVS